MGGAPTKLSDLVEGYELLRSASQQDPVYAENGRTILLYDERSVRIYMTREPQTWKEISLEVEVFLSQPDDTMNTLPAAEGAGARRVSQSDTRKLLRRCARYLDYLAKLQHEGFVLDPVAGDCVWTARRVLEGIPDAHLYKTISPPED